MSIAYDVASGFCWVAAFLLAAGFLIWLSEAIHDAYPDFFPWVGAIILVIVVFACLFGPLGVFFYTVGHVVRTGSMP